MKLNTKLNLKSDRILISAREARLTLKTILSNAGCNKREIISVSDHLVDTSLCGMESHGLMRILEYIRQYNNGYMQVNRSATIKKNKHGGIEINGNGGIGIPTMTLAYKKGMSLANKLGISALSIRDVGHTGRHGSFADIAASQGFLTILLGGGNRQKWRQVAPFGGSKAILPTNPYCIGIPGGSRGPVILDFATSKISGGWIYAAKSAGALLPTDCIIDSKGKPSRNPDDYFNQGAILPAGEQKGYALAVIAELIGEALLGPATTECNWLLITVKANQWRSASRFKVVAEEILNELRQSPTLPNVEKVEIPGEREREHRLLSKNKIAIPIKTWSEITKLLELNKSLKE